MKYRQTARMRTIAPTRLTQGRHEDRRLELMLGASCLILAVACLLLASVLGARTFFSRTKQRDISIRETAANVSVKDISTLNDSKIRDAVLRQLRGGSCCDKVTASVNDGVVVLGGEVAEAVDRDAAGYFASTVPAVKEVRNNVTVPALPRKPNRAASAAPAMEPSPGKTSNRKKEETSRPDHSDQTREAKVWIDEGESTLDNGDYGRAIQYFNRALGADPRNARALRGLKRAQTAQNAETAVLGNRY